MKTNAQIEIYRGKESWLATYKGELAQLTRGFGTDTLPTDYEKDMHPREVINLLKDLYPTAEIVLK